MTEEWKDIPGYEGLYQASSSGRIRSINRIIVSKDGKIKLIRGLMRNGHPYKNGYLGIVLCKNGIKQNYIIHRIIAKLFVPNPSGLPEVNHKDEDKSNNNADNLEWFTHKQNANYGTKNVRTALKNKGKLIGCRNHMFGRTGSKSPVYGWHGKDHPSSIPIIRISKDGHRKEYENGVMAAHDLNVSPTAISNVLRGKTKTCKGYFFEYINA